MAPGDQLVSSTGPWAPSQQRSFRAFDQSQEDCASISNQCFGGTLPTPLQQASIGVLKDLDDGFILACLVKLRAVKAGLEERRVLSSQQIDSILALSGCSDILVLSWLESARRKGISNSQQSSASAVGSFDFEPWHGSPISAPKSVADPIGPAPPYGSYTHTSPNTSSSLNQRHISLGGSRGAFTTSTNRHTHGCPRCPRRSFDTCDGWKRHMKEHETIWPCQMCEGILKSGKSSSYTRKTNLVKHLVGKHNLADPGTLANEVRRTRHKRYFGCGFCTTLLASLTEQLNHIDNEHFKQHQHIQYWDTNKVIRGLLQQREIGSFLQHTFRIAQDGLERFTWNQAVAEHLQERLEVGDEPAGVLASAAMKQRNRGWYEGNGGAVPVLGVNNQQRQTFGGFPAPHNQAQINPGPRSSQEEHEETATTDVYQAQNHAVQEWFPQHPFDIDTSLTQAAFTPDQAGYLQAYESAQYKDIDDVSQTISPTDESTQWAQPQDSCSGSSISSAPRDSQSYGEHESTYNTSWTSGESQLDISCIFPSNATPKAFNSHLAYPPSTSSHDGSNKYNDFNSLSLSSQKSTSLGGYASDAPQGNTSFLSIRRPKRQTSQAKLQNHYGPALDFDFLEYSMLDDDHTRSMWGSKRTR